jgi:hypothetical protein
MKNWRRRKIVSISSEQDVCRPFLERERRETAEQNL